MFFENILVLVAFAVLLALGIRIQVRLNRMEREHKALLGFVLRMPADLAPAAPAVPAVEEPGEAPQAFATDQVSAATEPAPAADAPPAAARDDGLSPVAGGASPEPREIALGRAAAAGPRDVETLLGTRWAVWVGGVALALGGVFLVRYSIEAGWFGPAARLTLAALFGLVLLAAGEFVRRTGFRMPVEGAAGAYIPAILTAAGAFSLFATIYAAHAVYGFVGPSAAFTLLGVVGVGTVVLSLLHGQALGGLGLLGSLVTPVLVASKASNHWALFVFLAIVLAATVAVARLRLWTMLATAAFAGMGIWILLYLATTPEVSMNFNVVLFAALAMLAVLAVLWLGNAVGEEHRPERPIDAASVATAIFLAVAVLVLCNTSAFLAAGSFARGAAILVAMFTVAFARRRALPLLFGSGVALLLVYARPVLSGTWSFGVSGEDFVFDGFSVAPVPHRFKSVGAFLAVLFLAGGAWKARRYVAALPARAAFWAGWAAAVPVAVIVCLWLAFGDPGRDYHYAAFALLAVALLTAMAEGLARAEVPPLGGGHAVSCALVGAGVAALAFLHMAFDSILTTILVGLAAVLPALATRRRSYPVLGWLCLGAALAVLVRCAVDPTIIGAAALGTTPVFNALLPGYGIPALAFGFCAWQLARTTDGRPRLAMEAAAILFALLTVGMLVRHAMNGGIIDAARPTLAEQAIYTLMSLGAGAILLALDRKSPSPVMRYGSIGFGMLSVAMAVLQHFLLLDPLFTNESTGRIAFFNLLFLGYLLPALAAGGLALYARGKRPPWYPAMLGLLAAALAFAYATLSVRRWFQGEFIGLWKDFTQLETYAYSAVWLLLGVLVLVIGVWQRSYVLRVASAVLIAAAVLKVFLIDMSELEGVLRALSFMGLGAALIGIGLFYQRLLRRVGSADAAVLTPPA